MKKLSVISNHSLSHTQWFIVFFIAALVLWGISLGNVPLRDWDEGTRALVAREIYRTGNWLYPTLQGKSYLLKPPLMDWAIALSYSIGGVHEFTTRLPGAFFSACGVPLLYGVGQELFRQTLPAVFAASVYLTLLPVVRHGRLAMLDGTAVSFFLLLLFCLLKSRQDRRWAVGVGLGVGLISLTKGLLVVPLGAIAGAFLLANRQFTLFKSPYFWLGLLLGNAPVFAWYIAQWQHYGTSFLQVHFQSQGLERLSQTVENNGGYPWYYLLELLKYTWPWLIFLPGGLSLAWQKCRSSWGCLVLIGTIGYLLIISVMNTKLPWYIMPVYPFVALAVAAQLTELWQNHQYYPRFLMVIFGFLAVAGLGGCVYFILSDPQPGLIIMGGFVAMTMGLVTWYIQHNNPRFILILLLGMYLILGLLMTSKSWLWELNEAFSVEPVAALIREHTSPNQVVYTSFGYGRPSLNFYSDRQIIPADSATLQQVWSKQPYLLLDSATLATLSLPDSVSLGTAEGFTLVAPKPQALRH